MTSNVNHVESQKEIFNPAVKALQFRAWQHCQTFGTDMTVGELAAAIDADPARLRRVLRDEVWAKSLRSSSHERPFQTDEKTIHFDDLAALTDRTRMPDGDE